MSAPQPHTGPSLAAFLAWEAGQTQRHEYLRGEIFAMTGARDAHNTIAGNVFAHLRAALRGGPCRAFIADMKLRIDAADAVFYPDLLVTCDARDRGPDADTAKRHPTLVVEILSESTAAYDRGLKFELYRQCESLREYVLVEQDRRQVDVFRRGADGRWSLYPSEPGAPVEFASLATAIALDTIYEDVAFPGPANG